ncbi:MAG: type IV toxin-antitoxin system AbiEi family antitoxin domain-containing protein [Bacteroidota bacterium]|nr:type IV toxin-antitoxin system AbiEi family antitoxin domain-containing protein [Bacteroidota bacterium]
MAKGKTRTPRLRPLLNDLPPGFIVDTKWLRARGIDSKSIHHYIKHGWIERIVHGVYRRPLPESVPNRHMLSWQAVLVSLQQLMGCNIHLGGSNALDFAGHTHYVMIGKSQPVHFYGNAPSWLRRLPTVDKIISRRSTLFGGDPVGIVDSTTPAKEVNWTVGVWNWPIKVSCPERAILELVAELRGNSDFENVDLIFENLIRLRPQLLMRLLLACRSVKVRRLFFVFAERHKHDWLEFLEPNQIEFGSGPRALVKGGGFHPTYRISVPEFLLDTSYEDGSIF